MKPGIAILTVFLAALSCPAKDWKIFCIPEKHLDVGWAYLPADALDQGYPGSVEDFQNFITLRALFMRDETAKYPPEARYKWYFDGAWQIEQMERYMPRAAERIRGLVNAGEFSYNPIYAGLHSLYLSHEQLMRMMALGRVLEDKGFRRSVVASQGDVPTVAWGFASALASAGVKYFLKGVWYNSPYSRNLAWIEPAPLFRWVGPDGRKLLVFYHDHYGVMADGAPFGAPLTTATVEKYIRKYELFSEQGKWPYDAFPMFGSEGDWGVPNRQNSDFVREWNKSHPSARLLISTPEEFFEYIETRFADKVPDGVRGGWGISYDLVEGNAVRPGARARENDHVLLAAEAFASLGARYSAQPYPRETLRQAWMKQVLYHEHSFGMRDGAGPEGRRQYAWKTKLTEQVEETGRAVLNAALQTLAARIPAAGEERVSVFNSLSRPQTGPVELPFNQKWGTSPPRVVEVDTGREAPSQALESNGRQVLRFRADSVPPLGYKTFRIEPGAKPGATTGVAADATARTLENRYYRLTLGPDGAIAGLFDKELKLEIFEARAGHRGNQFIFKDDAWRDHSPAWAEVSVENQGAVSATLQVRSAPTSLFTALQTRYTLYEGLKRLDVENSFTKQPGKTASNETVFYAFPFAVPGGAFRLDIPGVVARYPHDFRPETDWSIMPAQSFAAVANDRVSVVLATREAPNFEFGAMRKFFDHPSKPDLSSTTVFAQPLTKQTVNKDDYDLEGGAYTFHYALTSQAGPFRAANALQFAWAFQRGLAAAPVTGGRSNLPAAKSFMAVEPSEVLVSAVKQADDGRDLIVRLWNPGDQPVDARLSPAAPMEVFSADLMERETSGRYETRGGTVVIPCGAREFVTIRLRTVPEATEGGGAKPGRN